MELAKDKIRVNAVSPGVIATPIFGKALGFDESRIDETVSDVTTVLGSYAPLDRAGFPEDVAKAAVFLASEESSYVTGHNLVVDGGMTMGLKMEAVAERISKVVGFGKDTPAS